jgi:hypothetical protein
MASTLSNLYVERASSEHPLALWMLNEQVDYVSQITEAQRQLEVFANWDIVNAEAVTESSNSLNVPFRDSATTRIIGIEPPTSTIDIAIRSKFVISNNFVSELSNFNIGFYVFLETSLANTISFGYQYTDVATSQTIEVLSVKDVRPSYQSSWQFFANTFDLPPAPSVAQNVKLIIKVNVSEGGSAGSYDFLINGLSIGQWSEEFNQISFGVTPNPLPSNIALPSQLKSLPAFPYGASGDNAYYLSQGFQLFAKNFGVPLVFGSSNVTKITPNVYSNTNYPSLIFPGYGFLNERGRYNDYTVEMWVRINSESLQPRKIFGPISSSDGLYVDGAFLSLKVGSSVASHFVGDWLRPMLIHIKIIKDSAILILNGEQVAALDINQQTISLAQEFNQSKQSQDWLGFYSYEDVSPISIDNFSIYSYPIPTEVTKKRWVWGQAVASPEQTNSSINSVTAFNDYAFANYAANYNYPDFANWKQGFFSNVNAESKVLSLPDYQLPDFNLGARSTVELFQDIKDIAPNLLDLDDVAKRKYITLFPDSSWDVDSDHLYFKSFAVLSEPAQTIYGVFKTDGTEQNKVLLKITNKISSDSLSIILNQTTITYSASISGLSNTIKTKTISPNKKFAVGIDIKKLSKSQDARISKFFTDQSALDLYVGGDGFRKFRGKIYKVGFDAAYNSKKTSWMYDDDGIISTEIKYSVSFLSKTQTTITYRTTQNHNYLINDRVSISGISSTPSNVFNLSEQAIVGTTDNTFTISATLAGTPTVSTSGFVTDDSNILYSHTANYTLTAIDKYDLFFPDIAIAGYWEDYTPLSYFGKEIINNNNDKNYELDLIQYNQDFPQPAKVSSSAETSTWKYGDLRIEYSSPTVLDYSDLNNQFYTGWENYLEMSQNSVRTSFYDTAGSSLRSYVSFQKIKDGANKNLVDFTEFAKPLTSGILDPGTLNLDWQKTAFETTSGTVIYPPQKIFTTQRNIDFKDYAIVYHLDFKSDGIFHNPISFKELQLASQVLERRDFTPIGSRFGIPVYYYTKRGLYYDLKAKNPISTYKKSTPYLHLDRHSGWKIKGEFNSLIDRGIAVPINLSRAENTEVSSIQMWIRFADREFPEDPIMIFSIEHNEGTYDFFIQSDSSNKRGSIFAVNRDSQEIIDDIGYFLNGQEVYRPFLSQDEWAVLGLEFKDLLNFSSRTGRISLNGPLTYNNISYNLATNIEKNESIETRSWSELQLVERSAPVVTVTRSGNQVTYKTNVSWREQEIPKRVLAVDPLTGYPTWQPVAGQTEEVGDLVTITGASPSAYNLVNARVTSVNQEDGTFTVTSPTVITQDYTSGGIVTASNWYYIQDSLEDVEGDTPPYNWKSVKIISESREFTIDPKAIYEKYTGSNRIVIDDESRGILIDPDRIRVYKNVDWVDRLKIPV